ncbi:MAG: alkaline phosphatase family protein [Gemmatimonadaceae bacterium]
MLQLHRVVRALAVVGLAGCADLQMAPIDEYPVAVRRVVLISLDGVRADALPYLPTVSSLTQRAVWTDAMETVLPALTLPAHLSMLTGRDVTQYGITINTMDAGIAAVMRINGITPMFSWARAAGMRSGAVAGMSLIPPSQRAEAQSFFAVDTLIATDGDAPALASAAIALLAADTTLRMMFLHFPDADFAGHTYGWIGDGGAHTGAYRAALAHMDSAIATVWSAIAPSVDSGHTALLITADHGGGHGEGCNETETATHTHCTAHPGDRLVPFLLIARGASPGQLTVAPTIMQVAPTIGALLGIAVPERAERAIEIH